jgi:hypothetical protein
MYVCIHGMAQRGTYLNISWPRQARRPLRWVANKRPAEAKASDLVGTFLKNTVDFHGVKIKQTKVTIIMNGIQLYNNIICSDWF